MTTYILFCIGCFIGGIIFSFVFIINKDDLIIQYRNILSEKNKIIKSLIGRNKEVAKKIDSLIERIENGEI